MFLDLQVDVLERLEIPIVQVKVLYVKFIHITSPVLNSVCHIGAGSRVDDEHQHQQHHCGGIGFVGVKTFAESNAYICTARVRPPTHEGIRHTWLPCRRCRSEPPSHPRYGPRPGSHPSQDAWHGRGQHHPEHGAQPSGTQAEAAFPVAVRHRQQAPPRWCA